MNNAKKYDFLSSLKSIETENILDRLFYRPIGYQIALFFTKTRITPNMITIVSIFTGIGAGLFFYPTDIWLNVVGILLLILSNILDCVDGQLARLTGIKSEVGRILDGVAGDLWFLSIYVCIALRISPEFGAGWAWTLAALAGASNLIQANITDYYKTLHLYFISIKKGAEFLSVDKVLTKYNQMSRGINKGLFWLYLYYTILQTKITPQLQKLLANLKAKYGEDIPEDVRLRLRKKNLETMPFINLTTFNGRSIPMIISLCIGMPWIYLLYEIVVLNI
ncbi:MAG: CDP-alcohol phosphatidyltransferase family protein, partial [Paludibacter sp.]|nr:CDP-alcohol phosphatidyltransferase family protein [Paludibacter sp.]